MKEWMQNTNRQAIHKDQIQMADDYWGSALVVTQRAQI